MTEPVLYHIHFEPDESTAFDPGQMQYLRDHFRKSLREAIQEGREDGIAILGTVATGKVTVTRFGPEETPEA